MLVSWLWLWDAAKSLQFDCEISRDLSVKRYKADKHTTMKLTQSSLSQRKDWKQYSDSAFGPIQTKHYDCFAQRQRDQETHQRVQGAGTFVEWHGAKYEARLISIQIC